MKKFIVLLLITLPFIAAVKAQSIVINRLFNGTALNGQYDAIELLVIKDHLDITNWILKDYSNNVQNGAFGDWGAKLRFKDHALWKNLRSGTIIVIRKGDAAGNFPSPNPTYTEDTDASDFIIDINAANTTYLRSIATPDQSTPPIYAHKALIFGDIEMVLLRWDDGTGEGMGSANSVHAFAYGDVTNLSHFTGVTAPKLHVSTSPANGAYAYPLSENQDSTDYAGIAGISKNPSTAIYNNPAFDSEPLSLKLKNNTTLVKTIISDVTFNNYPGVKESYISYLNNSNEPIALYILEIDLKDPKLSIEMATPKDQFRADTTQRVSNMLLAKNNNSPSKKVLAAINGDYFTVSTGVPLGPVHKDGIKVRSNISTGYKFFGLMDNRTYMIGNYNDYVNTKERFLELIGGRYLLLQNGNIVGSTDGAKNPRTSIGLINPTKAIIVVVDGRQSTHSVGYTLPELSIALQALGVKDAINLDGGGSSVFIMKETNGQYKIKNKVSDGSERSVANGLLLMRKE
jgi:exopolysaccharide biosynthesis protein